MAYGLRGLGFLQYTPAGGQNPTGPLFTCPTGEQVYYSSQCPGGAPAPDVQQQISDLWSSIFAGQNTGPQPSSTPNWMVYGAAGVAVFALLIAAMGRR